MTPECVTLALCLHGVAQFEWNLFEVGQLEPGCLCLNQLQKKKNKVCWFFFKKKRQLPPPHPKKTRHTASVTRVLNWEWGTIDIYGINIQARPFDLGDRTNAH